MNRFYEFKCIVWNALVTRSFFTASRFRTKLFPVICEEGLTIEKNG